MNQIFCFGLKRNEILSKEMLQKSVVCNIEVVSLQNLTYSWKHESFAEKNVASLR